MRLSIKENAFLKAALNRVAFFCSPGLAWSPMLNQPIMRLLPINSATISV